MYDGTIYHDIDVYLRFTSTGGVILSTLTCLTKNVLDNIYKNTNIYIRYPDHGGLGQTSVVSGSAV